MPNDSEPAARASGDPYALARFVEAQAPVFAQALAELRAGRKRSHWMWFVFPQLAGLGRSATAARYAIGGLDEARAFLRHPLLGERLRACAATLLTHDGLSAAKIFGHPDELKLRSSMTLFAAAAPEEPLFAAVLDKYFASRPDRATLDLLKSSDWE